MLETTQPARVTRLLIKAGEFMHHSGFALYGNPPRWHKVHHDKPAPKGAPLAVHPKSAGDHAPAKHFNDEQWSQLKLPAENTNAPSYNAGLDKLKAHSEAGDVTAIVGSGYGTNTYGKKLTTVANHLLGLHGSEHKVAPGQKAGAHPAVQQEPKFSLSPAQEAGMIAAKVEGQLFDADQSVAFAKLDLDQKKALVAKVFAAQHALEQAAAKVAQAAQAAPVGPTIAELQASGHLLATSKLAQIPWDKQVLPDGNTNAKSHNAQVEKIKAMAYAGDAAGLQSYVDAKAGAKQTYAKKQHLLAQTALAALKESAPVATEPPSLASNDKKFIDEFAASKDATTLSAIVANSPVAAAKEYAQQKLNELAQADAGPKDGIVEMDGFKFKQGEVTGAWNFQHSETLDWHPVENSETLEKLAELTGSPTPVNNGVGDAKPAVVDVSMDDKKGVVDTLAAAGDVKLLTSVYEANAKAGNEELANYAKKALYRLDKTALAPAAAPADVSVSAMEFKNTYNGHNKFWSASVNGNDFKTVYGKIGTQGQTTVKTFKSHEDATAAMAALVKEKEKSGYVYDKFVTHTHQGTAETGPQDGDTKQGADGQLVFKDGHWHKVEVAADPIDAVAVPDFLAISPGKFGLGYASVAQALIAAVKANGADGLKGIVVNHADGRFTIKVAGWSLKKVGPEGAGNGQQKARQAAMHKFVTELKAAAGKPKKAPKLAAAPPALEPVAEVHASMDAWTQTGPQAGSNPGGRYKDPSGQEWYCKFPADEDIAKSEVLAAKLYSIAGLVAQDAQLVTKDGKVGIASKWTDVKKASSPAALAKAPGAQDGFAVDAWLANWDVVGMGFDNLQIGADGKAVRIDAGGSLEYRAQGAKKPFGPSVTEIDTMRDAWQNAQSGTVFGKMTKADITASVRKVAEISDAQIRATVAEFGPGDIEQKKVLAEILIARKLDLIARYPKASKQTAKKALDPAALPINPTIVPKPHDFDNWNGPGKGLSSKDHVNKANSAAEYQMFALAQAGNLTALQKLEFPEVDKETGQPTGKMLRLNQHPSKNVAQYHADLMQILDEVANPPEALKVFRETDVGTIHAIDAAFPPKPFGTTVSKVASNEKMGFWVVLGAVKGTSKFMPKATSHYTSMAVAKAKEKFKSASQLARHFIQSVQSSGSYNDLFRNGKTEDSSGNKLSDVAKAALQQATEMPEGTTIYRWLKIPPQMMEHINSAKDGTVFQATGPMCTSYDATATKNFGSHRMVIRYAKGAKAVESFGSGGYAGEKEVTTLPNARFVILSKKMVPDIEHGNHSGQRLELEVLMLPPDLGIKT